MSNPAQPVVLVPLFKEKPWGGRRLDTLFDKQLPGDKPIGESWEVVSLPGNESVVRDGPLAGQTLAELVAQWGLDLLGPVSLFDGRFPLLVKFLDACDHLSVQVHPKPDPSDPHGWRPGIKHEAWYILHAEPDAELYVGLNPNVSPEDVQRVANTPEMVNVLRTWQGRTGDCYYLPSGTLHALGKGLVVAEVQTPSDVTFRAYDWNRVGLDGQPRELHIDDALANIRYDVTEDMVRQPPQRVAGPLGLPAKRITECERFNMDIVETTAAHEAALETNELRIWLMLNGGGELRLPQHTLPLRKGDVALIPAASAPAMATLEARAKLMDVTIPTA
jgi:mannose-6-phosphate isomerase